MNSKTTKTKTTTDKPKENAGNEKADDFVATATSWCAEHNVPTRMMPDHTLRLVESAVLIDHAITEAGGPDKVPESVLIYRQLLNEAALATAMHGIKRSILAVFGGLER
jgi:hypothetical protein